MNTRIWILALIFGLAETAYFGWNLIPQSPAEMVCDGITFLLCALAMIAPRREDADNTQCDASIQEKSDV